MNKFYAISIGAFMLSAAHYIVARDEPWWLVWEFTAVLLAFFGDWQKRREAKIVHD